MTEKTSRKALRADLAEATHRHEQLAETVQRFIDSVSEDNTQAKHVRLLTDKAVWVELKRAVTKPTIPALTPHARTFLSEPNIISTTYNPP